MAAAHDATSNMERDTVEAIRSNPRTKVLVVGGGINGIAAFRDIALQGVDVVLIERGDYASGASAASSHMIHGGIRYLENGEFRLVRESVQERNGLLTIAPHYVKPLETTMPIFSTMSGILAAPLRFLTHKQRSTKERGALLIEVGMTIYDSFSRNGGSVPKHRFRMRRAALADLPRLNRGIKYTATYYDASVHEPERLALDVLQDGLATGPHARAANYVEAIGVDGGGVLVRDRESGTTFAISADVVLNTSGPWTDLTNSAFGTTTKYMGGTKGSHIVLDHPELVKATRGRELFFENNDGRIVLIYPLKGRVLVGTTDLEADPAKPVVCTDDEIQYFFDLVHHVFPDIAIDRSQIVYTYAGIRPLPHHDDTAPGFVSRDYRIVETPIEGLSSAKVLSLVGGKWTTFRALAEHVSSEALAALGRTRTVETTGLAIGGGRDFPTNAQDRADWLSTHAVLDADRMRALLARYGTRAAEVATYIADGDDVPIENTGLSSREIEYFVEHEQTVHLIDVVLRRTSLAFTGSLSAQVLADLADRLGATLGWTTEQRAAEIEATTSELRDAHLVSLGTTVSHPVPAVA